MQMMNRDPINSNRCLKCWLSYKIFRLNYFTYLQVKMSINNFWMKYINSWILMIEKALDWCWVPKNMFFFVRGYYPLYILINLLFAYVLFTDVNINQTEILYWTVICMIILKLVFIMFVVLTEPGSIEKDSKVEKYLKYNRKDLANIKTPMGLGTTPLRSNFWYLTK